VDGEVLLANVARFGRLLRRAGLDVDSGQTATFARALTLLGFDRRPDVRAAGRAIFVRRREDGRFYEAAFDLFWRRRAGSSEASAGLPRLRQDERREQPSDPAEPESDAAGDDEPLASVRAGAASLREGPSGGVLVQQFGYGTFERRKLLVHLDDLVGGHGFLRIDVLLVHRPLHAAFATVKEESITVRAVDVDGGIPQASAASTLASLLFRL